MISRVLASSVILLTVVACSSTRTQSSSRMFDDFSYTNTNDMARNGWIIRTAQGWPGVPGSSFGPQSFSFVDGAVRMTSWTGGTGANTTQSQLCHQRKYLDGTYAARVHFTDAPSAGADGDQVVQTFYFISPQKAPMDPDYSEIDFEYLPNGGWGKTGPTMFTTTWETFQLEPWTADNKSDSAAGSLEGWHTLVAQVTKGTVHYYIDGKSFAEHGDKYYPEVPMAINFNLWFVKEGVGQASGTRQYQEDIDWVYFDRNILDPEEVDHAVADLRDRKVTFSDTVPSMGMDSPCNF
jgi:hypothetical protein